MKQIKTVITPLERLNEYDNAVNELIKDGWILVKREIITISGDITEAFNAIPIKALYAELERYNTPLFEEVTL